MQVTDKHSPWPPPDWDEDVSDAYRLGVKDGRQQIGDLGQWILDLLQELQQAVKKADTETRWAQATASSITVISIIQEMKRRGMLV